MATRTAFQIIRGSGSLRFVEALSSKQSLFHFSSRNVVRFVTRRCDFDHSRDLMTGCTFMCKL